MFKGALVISTIVLEGGVRDTYLKMTGGQIHWFSILNSLMIMVFLSGMVAMILLRRAYVLKNKCIDNPFSHNVETTHI